MIELEVNNEIYNIPNSYKELKLKEYQQIAAIDKDDKFKDLKIIQVLSGIDLDVLKQASFHSLKPVIKSILFLFNQDNYNLQRVIKFENKQYGFIKDFDKLTFAEYIDLEEFSKEPIENIHILMAIFYRPLKNKVDLNIYNNDDQYETETYDDGEVLDRSEEFKNLDMDVVLGALFFFIILKLEFMKSLKASLKEHQKEIEKMMSHLKHQKTK